MLNPQALVSLKIVLLKLFPCLFPDQVLLALCAFKRIAIKTKNIFLYCLKCNRRTLTANVTGAFASAVHRLMVVRHAFDRAFRSEPKLKTCICPCCYMCTVYTGIVCIAQQPRLGYITWPCHMFLFIDYLDRPGYQGTVLLILLTSN